MTNNLLEQLLNLPIPKKLTVKDLSFYSKQLNKHEPGSKEFIDLKQKLIELGIPKDIPDNYLGVVISNWYENFSETPKYEQSDQTEAPVYQTTVNEKLDESIFEEAEKRAESEKQAREKAESDVKRGKEKQQQLYEERIARELKNKKVVVVPTETIPTVKLTDQDKEVLFTASQEAKKDPSTSTEFFKEKINESLSQADIEYQENITPAVIEKTAVSITENLRSLPDWESPKDIPTEVPSMNPVSPVIAITLLEDARLKGIITDEDARKKAVEMAQNFALGLESENIVNFAGAKSVFGNNIASAFYGPADGRITQFEITENQEEQRDEGVEIDIESIYDNGKKFYDLWGKIRSGATTTTTNEVVSTSLTYVPTYTYPTPTGVAVQTSSILTKALPAVGAVYGFRQGMLLQQWARSGSPLLTEGNRQILKALTSGTNIQNIASSSMWNFSKPFFYQNGRLSLVFTTGANQAKGLQVAMGGIKFGEKWTGFWAAKGGTQAMVGTVTAQAGSKIAVGTSSFLTKALTFLGGLGSWATAGLSLVAGWILGKIIEKIDWTKVKKFFKEVLGPLLLVGGGIMFGAPVLGLVAGGLAFGVARGLTLAGIGFGIWNFFRALGRAFAITIATPIIVTLLVLPPLVAFIMLVINTGAYLVPKASISGKSVNPYIQVTKTAEPSGPFENTDLPIKITYTITVTAKKDPLTNISFDHVCKITQESGSKPCDAPKETPPDSITPASPYIYTYETEYDTSNTDALIINTFTVTADAGEAKKQKSSGTATVTVGTPPTQCFDIDEASFSSEGLGLITDAVARLTTEFNPYASKICESLGGQDIVISYGGDDPNFWGRYTGGKVLIYTRGLANPEDTNYILFHEMAHVLASNKEEWYDPMYLTYPGITNEPYPYCFYDYHIESTGEWPYSERFAEAASFYANDPCGNFQQRNPAHYSFMQNIIYKP